MCLYPKLIQNPKYKPNKKNGYIAPTLKDERIALVPVGCGNCIECRKQKSREWQVRLNEEIRENKNGKFMTFTFTNESIKELKQKLYEKLEGIITPNKIIENEIAILGVRLFLERWRKKYKKSIRHWLITELGHTGTERIHIHGIIFTNETIDTITNIWKYGYVYMGEYVNEKTINYMVKYVTKTDKDHKGYKAVILTSAGIGNQYLKRIDANINKYKDNNTQEYYRTRKGLKLALPIYYRNKIYNDEQKEKLWINKIDKEERWIMGEKISTKYSDEEYFKTLQHYREKNNRLGYGNDNKEWDIKSYKESIKTLKRFENRKF